MYTIVQQLYKLFILSHNFTNRYKALQQVFTNQNTGLYKTLNKSTHLNTKLFKTWQHFTQTAQKMYKMFRTLQTVGNSAELHTQLYKTYTLKFTQHNFYNTSTKWILNHYIKLFSKSLQNTTNTILFTKLYKTFGF